LLANGVLSEASVLALKNTLSLTLSLKGEGTVLCLLRSPSGPAVSG